MRKMLKVFEGTEKECKELAAKVDVHTEPYKGSEWWRIVYWEDVSDEEFEPHFRKIANSRPIIK